jgi:outer membrane protein TolC
VTPVVSSYSSTAQNNYTIGGVVNIPISDFFDLSARVTRQRINARSAELEREIKFEELKKEIVQLYATATSQLTILKMKAENVMLASTQYQIVEKDFINGQANSSELSTEKANQTKALEEYEISKSQLNTSLLMLEIVTHTPLVNIPRIKK